MVFGKRGFCPGGFCPGVYVRGFCPGGFCPDTADIILVLKFHHKKTGGMVTISKCFCQLPTK